MAVILTACAPQTPRATVCTLDAKICPDGTAVGREGPNCDFAACPNSTDTQATTFKEYKSQDPEMCKAMRFTCNGGAYFSDETGCGCILEHANSTVTQCSNESSPVCGWAGENIKCVAYPCAQTYSNLCLASVADNVAYTTPGECPAVGSPPINAMPVKKEAFDCTEPRSQACTLEYVPVCGQKNDGTSSTYGNKCEACADSSVISYTQDACATDFAMYSYQPKQCETTPWQQAYEDGKFQFAKTPTDADLITAYYGGKNVEVMNVTRVDSGEAACEACSVCSTSYSFVLKVNKNAGVENLTADGWTLKVQNY